MSAVPPLRAVIFDVDGTIADTERDGHRPAFNAAFAEHGLDVEWDVAGYGRLLAITGGQRRIAADLRARGFGAETDEIAARVHRTKTALFRARVLGRRPGRHGRSDRDCHHRPPGMGRAAGRPAARRRRRRGRGDR